MVAERLFFDLKGPPHLNPDQDSVGDILITLPDGSPPICLRIVPPDEEFDDEEIRSEIVDFSFPNEPERFNAEICLDVILEEGEDIKDFCLGFFDETEESWYCEDPCLTERSFSGLLDGTTRLCGNTDHFTLFSILNVSDKDSNIKGPRCRNSSDNDGLWALFALFGILGILALCCCCCCFVFVIVAGFVMKRRKDEDEESLTSPST